MSTHIVSEGNPADNRYMAKQVTRSFQPDPDILEVLKRQAEEQDRTVSKLINLCLREHFVRKGWLKPEGKGGGNNTGD